MKVLDSKKQAVTNSAMSYSNHGPNLMQKRKRSNQIYTELMYTQAFTYFGNSVLLHAVRKTLHYYFPQPQANIYRCMRSTSLCPHKESSILKT